MTDPTLLAEVNDFWQAADGVKWHSAANPDKAPEVRRFYRWLYDRAVEMLGRVPERVVDWGCGGGMAAQQMMADGTRYYGVDIVQATLDACGRAIENAPGTFVPMLAGIDDPETCFRRINHCDLFVCLTVYQHFPDKAYAARITRLVAGILKLDGLAIIQTRQAGKRRPTNDTRPYKARWMSSVLFNAPEFEKMAESAGLKVRKTLTGKDWSNGYDYHFCERIQ